MANAMCSLKLLHLQENNHNNAEASQIYTGWKKWKVYFGQPCDIETSCTWRIYRL